MAQIILLRATEKPALHAGCGGRGGIRTHGRGFPRQRFSKPAQRSTATNPYLKRVCHHGYVDTSSAVRRSAVVRCLPGNFHERGAGTMSSHENAAAQRPVRLRRTPFISKLALPLQKSV